VLFAVMHKHSLDHGDAERVDELFQLCKQALRVSFLIHAEVCPDEERSLYQLILSFDLKHPNRQSSTAVQLRRLSKAQRSDRFRLNIDLGIESAVHGTLVRYLQKLLPLSLVERSFEMNVAFDSVDLAFLCFAVPTIRRVNL